MLYVSSYQVEVGCSKQNFLLKYVPINILLMNFSSLKKIINTLSLYKIILPTIHWNEQSNKYNIHLIIYSY